MRCLWAFFVMIAGAAITAASPASAAMITHEPLSKDNELISITGDIDPGDEEKFRKLALAYDSAAVSLDSNGGSLLSAIEIGKLIRIRNFATFVVAGRTCTSACALIWLSGAKRFLSPRGRLGFHASYYDENGKLQESGVGNALVGHYLSLLNLPEKAVVFTTMAAPTQIKWLTLSNRSESGIDFENFEDTSTTASTSPPPPAVAPAVIASTSYGPDWWFIGWTGDRPNRRVNFLDRKSIVTASNSAKVWRFIYDENAYSSGEKMARVLQRFDCTNHTSVMLEYVALDSSGNVLTTTTWQPYEQKTEEIQPDTIGSDFLNFACSGPNDREVQMSKLNVSLEQASANLLKAQQ